MFYFVKRMKKFFLSLSEHQARRVIYGVSDRRDDPWWGKLNDFFLDHSFVSEKTKSLFFFSLHLLLASGVSLIRALEILSVRQTNVRFRRILFTFIYDLQHGVAFSKSMEKFPFLFRSAEIGIVRAGEQSGKIEKNIATVAEQVAKNIEIRLRLQSALFYPVILLFAIVLAIVVVLTVVVPQFESLFAQFPDGKLPLATRVLIGLSDFVISFWWGLLGSFGAGLWWIFSWKKTIAGRKFFESLFSRIPFFHRIFRNSQTVEVSTHLASLLDAGIPVLQALFILEEIVQSVFVSESVRRVRLRITQGVRIFDAFRSESVFDPVLAEVLEIGEESGRITDVLFRLGKQYELEVETDVKNFSVLIEPLMILFMGGAVLFMAFAILVPVLDLQKLFVA